MNTFILTGILIGLHILAFSQSAFTDENGKKGIKDDNGNVIVKAQYDYIERISIVMPLANHSGYNKVQTNPANIFAKASLDNRVGLINYEGEVILPFTCNYINSEMSSDSILVFRPEIGKWSFIDLKTLKVVSTPYEHIKTFHEGMAAVNVADKKLGFIDANGELVIPANYESSNGFSEGIAKVTKNGNEGYINKSGNEITTINFDYASDFSHGIGIVNKGGEWINDPMLFIGGKWGIINQKGNYITELKYDKIGLFLDDKHIAVNQGCSYSKTQRNITGGKYAILDFTTGQEVTDFLFDKIEPLTSETPNVLRASNNGKFGLIDFEGNILIPIKYTSISSINADGYFNARIGKERYKVSLSGEEIKQD